MNPPNKILIIRPDRLGDLILSLPVAETLKKNFPSCEVLYLINPYTLGIANMIDYVDGWVPDSDKNNRKLPSRRISADIKSRNFDCLIELKPSWRTAIAGYLSGVKLRIGTSRRIYSVCYTHRLPIHRKASGFHQTDLELRHLDPFNIDEYITKPRLRVTDQGLSKAKKLLELAEGPFVVIHPGSGGSSPNWPVEHYRKLAVLIKKNLDCGIVVTDKGPIISGFEDCLDLGSKTDIETLAGVISQAEVFISGSTGPLHLADAIGTRCLSFFPNRPDLGAVRWGPRRNMDNVLSPPEICRCGDLENCSCLECISPDEAFEKLRSLLSQNKTAGVNKN